MADRGLETAVFVSDPTHMLRVLRMAADEGIDGLRLADADEPARARRRCRRVDAIVHELGALASTS